MRGALVTSVQASEVRDGADCSVQLVTLSGQETSALLVFTTLSWSEIGAVVRLRFQPLLMAPAFAAVSSTTNKLHVPFGSVFWKTDSATTAFEFPAGTGGGKSKGIGECRAVGLNVPDVNAVSNDNDELASSSNVNVRFVTLY